MEIIIIIPGLICAYVIYRQGPEAAFLKVYLPVFCLLPMYYHWKIAALPPFDFGMATLFPLAIGMAFTDFRHWRPSLMDIWIALFIFTIPYPDYLAGDKGSLPTLELFGAICSVGIPYLIGKLLIEQHRIRIETLKSLCFYLFLSAIVGAYEYRMEMNPFTLIFQRFFPNEYTGTMTQLRWGMGRASGPFSQSEHAGIIYFSSVILAIYLLRNHFWEKRFRDLPAWIRLNKGKTITWALGFTLLMTQARGPWLGFLLALPISLIGRTKRVLRNTIVVAVLGIPAVYFTYTGVKAYSSGPIQSEAQQNAAYRTMLIPNYAPVVQEGGLWGWGSVFPRRGGEGSIDNAYLFFALTQGYAGLAAFVLMAVTATYSLLKTGLFSVHRIDRYFSFSLLGILFGMLFTLYTVFLGAQVYEWFFLLMGWSQSIINTETEFKEDPPWGFKRVVT